MTCTNQGEWSSSDVAKCMGKWNIVYGGLYGTEKGILFQKKYWEIEIEIFSKKEREQEFKNQLVEWHPYTPPSLY